MVWTRLEWEPFACPEKGQDVPVRTKCLGSALESGLNKRQNQGRTRMNRQEAELV